MESNPGTFGVSAKRIPPPYEDDSVVITLTLGDARRLHHFLVYGPSNNRYNSIAGLITRLVNCLYNIGVDGKDLGQL